MGGAASVQTDLSHYNNSTTQETFTQVTCECGVTITKYYMSKHIKSKKHITKMEELTQQNNTVEESNEESE